MDLVPNKDAEVDFMEAGLSKFENITLTGVTGAQSIEHEVPVGKKWILKACSLMLVTVTSAKFDTFIYDTGTNKMLIWSLNPTTGTTESLITGFPQITMEAGWRIVIGGTCAGTGDIRTYLLIQEIDA